MRAATAVRSRWRRSLQLRVAVTTLVVSGLVTLVLGVLLLHQIQRGLLDAKTKSALSQLNFGLRHAAAQLDAADGSDTGALDRTADGVVADLAGRGNQADAYGLALIPTSRAGSTVVVPGDIRQSSIPTALTAVVAGQAREAWVYSEITYDDGRREPALVVGAPVPSEVADYQLYYLLPLTQEAQTVTLVEKTMLVSGSALVLLLMAIAALVTRQVVRPVRMAAATAERLAAGRLEDRMRVRGEDDLASLARSFNRMAGTVQQQISQLQELSRVQRRFVADVSHELRTPITTIRLAADVLHDSRGELPPSLARSAELLQTQLDRFEALLADLLEISRYDAGAAVLDVEPVDLRSLVEAVTAAVEPLAVQRGVPLVVDVPAEPVVADVDPRRIQRVLRNLVVNAVEHAEARPVELRMRGGDGGVAVTVRDHGVGLRPGEASLVFGRFWRADPARARTTGGTGLGLSIALEDVRLHGGWLQAWGAPGEGALFRMTLPWHSGEDVTSSPLALDPADDADDAAVVADEPATVTMLSAPRPALEPPVPGEAAARA